MDTRTPALNQGSAAPKEDLRDTDARLKQIVASLPASIIYNPLMTILAALPFVFGPRTFGFVSWWAMAAAIGVQLATSAMTRVIYVANRDRVRDVRKLQRELLLQQVIYSAGCGTIAWFFWCDGNPVNNMYVVLLMVCVVWAGAFTRAAHRQIMTVGTATASIVFMARFAIAPGTLAHVMTALAPLLLAYILVMGATARKRVDEMLSVRFANEDLTDALRVARDDALRKRFEAEAANASKTIFLANMSHELRTPLNAILGFSDIIAEQSFGSAIERYREYARDIHNSGAHLLSLINDLLDVAKIEAGKMEIDPQPLDLLPLLESVKRLMGSRALAKGQVLDFEVSPGLPALVADPRAFKQIVLNLVTNAVKFTPNGGRISVECGTATGGGVVVSVEDNGPGIPKEKLAKIFKPFSQVDNRYDSNGGGTGLGLALVQGLAQLHGGMASIESEVGKGTKVTVYFPLVAQTQAVAARSAR
ncbi:MAG TPA: HAMP domain-containing sensor histidine kinase [Rhizomicrobium sp.]|nr:HAMP domain-containing sensor histidine kinase [Rhizomicrobium sp.]